MEKTKLKDNKIYRIIIITICVSLCLFGRFIPSVNGFSSDGFGVLFIFIGTLILWLTIGMDWPSLLCIFSLSLIDSLGFNKMFQASFGNSTLIFLLFTFVCTYALSKTSLIKTIAIAFVNNNIAKKGGYYFITLFLTSVLILGLFMSPSVLFVIMLPILNEIFKIGNIQKDDKVAKVLMMGLGFSVSISSGMTLIAHVFPILAMNAANVNISQFQYTVIAFPTGLVLFVLMLLMFKLTIKLDDNKLEDIDIGLLKKDLPKITSRDITILAIFIVVILLWIVPSFFQNVAPNFYKFFNKYGSAMPPLLGTILLCVIRIKNEPLMKLEDAFKNGIPWTTLIVCAGTLALGAALTSDAIGIRTFLETNLSSSLATFPPIALLVIFALWPALQTNVSSNMVTATLVATVASSILRTLSSTSLNVGAIICIIGMLASFAFATPPSMPHIAIVAGSEYCSTKDVLIYGGVLMFLSVAVSLLIGYPIGMGVL